MLLARWRPTAVLEGSGLWPYSRDMATTTVKSTYSLDVETIRALEEMAQIWGVSKSEALRRAIRAARREPTTGTPKALAALNTLQASLDLASPAAVRWEKNVAAERRSASIRSESR